MKYYIITFGCQMNHSDSERAASVIERAGYTLTSNIDDANLILVNMCSVRQSAVDRIYGMVQKIKKIPNTKTILTGCILNRDKMKLSSFFDYVLDIKDIGKLTKILTKSKKIQADYLQIQPKYSNKFSAVIPIMTGCNNFCTYCVVPYTRGREISRKAKDIISEIKRLIKDGRKEIWLMGQNVNSYKDGKIRFADLLEKVDKIPGNFWIRFTSSHPKDFSNDLIAKMKTCSKVTKYLNLPVQAGDDKILKLMNRPYTIKQYKEAINKARKEIPEINISTDIIVGFPGETKKQFQSSEKLFRDVKYDMAYISEYSPRRGTVASKLKDTVSRLEKSRRKKALNEVLKQSALFQNKKYLARIVDVLIDTKGKNHSWIGKTKEYKTIQIKSDKNLLGKFVKTKVTETLIWGLKGELL